jgi:hypothetical protein
VRCLARVREDIVVLPYSTISPRWKEGGALATRGAACCMLWVTIAIA